MKAQILIMQGCMAAHTMQTTTTETVAAMDGQPLDGSCYGLHLFCASVLCLWQLEDAKCKKE